MSCTNPCLVETLDIRRCNIGDRERLANHGFKFSKDLNTAYHFAASESQKIPLENVSSWQDYRLIELPCGSCLSCRIDYAKDWAVRATFEASLWKHNYFITLSYDDDHLVRSESGNNTLSKEHIDDFIQAVRNYFKHRGYTGIRYLLCGEYNSSGERMLNPHYHLILFNCPIPDLTIKFPTPDGGLITKLNSLGLPMFYSPLISSIWDKGFIAIDDANYQTERYVSQYILKKQKGESSKVYSDTFGVIPPFIRMSNKPGIGFNAFLKEKDKYLIDPTVILPGNKKPLVTGIPRYYKRKLSELDPSLKEKFKQQAIDNESRMRTVRKHYNTTSNQQKIFKDDHLKRVQSVFSRDFES